jgi:nicotinate-nucleotide adenylyltransferase
VNVGVLGGTFDPPHTGHLIVAQDAALALGLDRILFIPAARPPHKVGRTMSPPEIRLKLLQLAVAGDDRFGIDTLELERTGPSFTVDTLRALRLKEPATSWTLLVGADQYAEFETWREPEAIRSLARIGVLAREGREPAARGNGVDGGPGVVGVSVTRIDISSTALRARVAAGLPIRYMVPDAVERFIREHGLYRRNGAAVTG